MSWCSGVSLSSKSGGFFGFWPGFGSSLLDSYSEESSSWFWAGGGTGSGGGAGFFAEQQGWAWMMILMALQELGRRVITPLPKIKGCT